MEPALHNSGSAADLMNCPKCGYAQERRPDCKKCGVVFTKYFAMYPSDKSNETPPATRQISKEPPEQVFGSVMEELQTQVHSLSNRFNDVEFEKAERNQLRIDLKNVEQQFHEKLSGMEARLVQCEKLYEQAQVPQTPPPAPDADLSATKERLDRIEDKLGSADFAGQYMIELSEKTEANSCQLSDLQNQLAVLQDELAEVKTALDLLSQCVKEEEPKTPLEEDVHIIRKNLDELRQFFSKHISS